MFNPSNLAKEIFSVLRSFDYSVAIFDFAGNRVYEPKDARRFFASPKNITVSLLEDGENSIIKLFLSKSTDTDEVMGLIETMRTTASRYGILFNVRKYQRELRPRDLSPNSGVDNEVAVPIRKSHDLATQLDVVKDELKNLTTELPELINHMKEKTMNESETINLPSLNSEVDVSAWSSFRNGSIGLLGDPAEITNTGDTNQYRVDALREIADKTQDESLSALFVKMADAIEAGSRDRVILDLADKATDIVYLKKELAEPEVSEDSVETIRLPALKLDVEKDAWEQFKSGDLEFEEKISLTGDDARDMLRISKETSAPLLAKLFLKISKNIQNEETTPLMDKIVKRAIHIVKNTSDSSDREKLIVTESIREFNDWFESYSVDNIFENTDEDDGDFETKSVDAYNEVSEEFDPYAFLADRGEDFNYQVDMPDEDKIADEKDISASLKAYFETELEMRLDGQEYGSKKDIDELVDTFMPDVRKTLESEGWKFDLDESVESVESVLKTEDVLLPSDETEDFVDEVTVDRDADLKESQELARLISLALGTK